MLHGNVMINAERLVEWQAIRRQQSIDDPTALHDYDCDVWWFEPGAYRHTATVGFHLQHRPVLGASSLAVAILAQAAIEDPRKR